MALKDIGRVNLYLQQQNAFAMKNPPYDERAMSLFGLWKYFLCAGNMITDRQFPQQSQARIHL